MREILLAVVMLSAGLAGCIGDDTQPTDPASIDEPDGLNPWQRGLDDAYPTPNLVEHRSADERRSNVAPPGDPEFAAFDAEMEAWMQAHNISAGQLALVQDGELRYERGYGHTDRDSTESTNASTMFRVASITKPIMDTLIELQVRQGLYNWTDPVFCLGEDPPANCQLPITPHPERPVQDDRFADIQVQHLLNHTSGIPQEPFRFIVSPGPIQVAQELGVPTPPSAWRTVQYVMGEELAHEPGQSSETRDQYNNVGYTVAGLVPEAATGVELEALLDAYLFEPLEVDGDIEPGRSLPSERNPREPFYACDPNNGTRQAPSVFDPNETVCWPDGGQSLETNLANGGLVSTAAAVATVYAAYQGFGSIDADPAPVNVRAGLRYALGDAPGTAAGYGFSYVGLEEPSRVGTGQAKYVFLFNSREAVEPCSSSPYPLKVSGIGCTTHSIWPEMHALTAAWGASSDRAPVGGVIS